MICEYYIERGVFERDLVINMKLLFVANIRLPTEKAHGIQIMKMCESFALQGVSVELLVPRRFNPIKTDPFVYHGVNPIFRIRRYFTLDLVSLGKLGYYVYLGVSMLSLNLFLLGRKLFHPNDTTVVYVRGEPILFLDFISRFIYPVFWETHIKPPKYLSSYLRSVAFVKGVVTVTDFYKKELQDFYKVKPRVHWAPDGVTISDFDIALSASGARTKLGLPQDKKIALYTGSFYLYDYKGVDVLIESARHLPDDYLVLLVGGSKKDIERIIGSGVNLDNIKLISHVPHADIPIYLRSADVLVLPNKKGDEISEKYTSPLKLFEYMAAKKPIVSSGTICLLEILHDTNAYIFEASNSRMLAEAIVEAVNNTQKSKSLSEQAFIDVGNLTWEKRARGIMGFIENQLLG